MDGCSIGCARAILADAGIKASQYLVLTDLGIEKNKNFDLDSSQIYLVKTAVKEKWLVNQEATNNRK
jgi:uncharacterized metal-binding protein